MPPADRLSGAQTGDFSNGTSGEITLGTYNGFTLDHDCGIGMTIVTSTIEQLGGYVYVMPRFGPYHEIGAGLEIVLPRSGPRSA